MSIDLLYGIGLIWFLVFLVISLVQQLRTFPDDEESEKENKPVMWFFIGAIPFAIVAIIKLFILV